MCIHNTAARQLAVAELTVHDYKQPAIQNIHKTHNSSEDPQCMNTMTLLTNALVFINSLDTAPFHFHFASAVDCLVFSYGIGVAIFSGSYQEHPGTLSAIATFCLASKAAYRTSPYVDTT